MKVLTMGIRQLYLFRLDPGDDLLEGLQKGVRKAGIQQGVIVAAIGSLVGYHFHVVDKAQWPPVDVFLSDEGGFDILSLQGYVVDGRVHAHIGLSNAQTAIGGHLEQGCEVFTFAAVTVAELDGVELTGVDKVGEE